MQEVIFLPSNISVFASVGKSLLDLAFENDIIIEHNCGGVCACTSCRVIIEKGLEILRKKSEDEVYLLSKEGFTEERFRLSCQCIIEKESNEKIIIRIPE